MLRIEERVEFVANAPWVNKRVNEQDFICIDRMPDDASSDVIRAVISYVQARNIDRWPPKYLIDVYVGRPNLNLTLIYFHDGDGCESGLVIDPMSVFSTGIILYIFT